MSVSTIIGNTDDEKDARRVPWVNIVCNSLYTNIFFYIFFNFF